MTDALAKGVEDAVNFTAFQRAILRRLTFGLAAMVLIGVVAFSVIGVYVSNIRQTQLQSQPLLSCELHGVNNILKDVPLAFSGDHNKADYSAVVPCRFPKGG